MSKRPKDMTENERKALPIGPISYIERDATYEEMKAGKGVKIRQAIIKKTKCVAYSDDDLLAWSDENGENWMFGQYEDGTWFKRPALF